MSATATAEKPVRKFPTPCWTQDEALALIQAYRERWYALRRGFLRTADWDAVAEEVGRLYPGAIPPKTSAQCRHKIEKLRQRYRAEKQRSLSFPGGQFLPTWFYFEAMDSMERNGNGSNPDEETQSGSDLISDGMKFVNSKNNHQSNTRIRFKAVAADSNLITIASRSRSRARANNFRDSHNYNAQEEDNDEFEDAYNVETIIGKNSGKIHRLPSQNYQNLQHSGIRPRKFSKSGDHDYREKVKRNNDSIGEIVSSIRLLADGFVRMEKMKIDVVHEIETMRMQAEMKREELLLESQKQIVQAFLKGLSDN
ncbi:hypothetical protein L1987_72027 [Smallanthus sonchifolius]|uniref:Uncharacterized protein n=1 Tax=Smallanthus sonchifolius TaxID=185202 RepID=A0ACB9AU27_9ASTR|nr:hypothetical protein L1987_72027 [Smallanthus sonchifolius]